MPSVTHAGFKIKSIADGTLYRARVERSDGTQFRVNGKITTSWESSQSVDAEAAIGQAIYAMNTGKINEMPNQSRRRGAQPGNQNAYRHRRWSARAIVERKLRVALCPSGCAPRPPPESVFGQFGSYFAGAVPRASG